MDKSRGIKNISFGLIAQIVTISLGIVIPRLVLVNLGSEANGLLSSINSALSYMSLLEAGVGTATIQALYYPIANKDRNKVSSIMSATHYFYRRTGVVYFFLVLVIAILFSFFSKSTIPSYNIFLVTLLSGFSGVLNYFFQGKFRILLSAEGKNYITTNIGTITNIGVSLTKIVVLIAGGNVVVVQIVYFSYNLLQMLIYAFYMRRNYGWINYHSIPDFEAISQRNAVLVHQISGLVFNNTDIMVLTLFSGFKSVSIYSMYAMIFGMIKSVVVTFAEGFVYALGQSYHDREKFLRMYDVYEVFVLAMVASLFCITRILIIPFLRLYTQGVNDVNYIDPYIPWLFTFFYLLHYGRQPSANIISIAQKFEETKWRSILETVINLTVSIVLAWKIGIYGVLFGTIAALFYRTNDIIIYASRIIKRTPWKTYRRWLTDVTVLLCISYVADHFMPEMNRYTTIFMVGCILVVIVSLIFIFVNYLFDPDPVKYAFRFIKEFGIFQNRTRD